MDGEVYQLTDEKHIYSQIPFRVWLGNQPIYRGVTMNRRTFLKSAVAVAAVSSMSGAASAASSGLPKKYQNGTSPWPMCLNTSTIRPTPILKKIDAAAGAGFDALELWTQDLEKYQQGGGNVKELGRRIRDKGMFVVDVIGLWDGMPGDEDAYRAQMPTNRVRMKLAGDVGSRHIAVLPLPDRENFDLKQATVRYRELLEIGLEDYGIRPAMEFVSIFKGVTRMGQAAQIALDADHPKACIIPDTFHLHNGGSGFNGIKFLQGDFIASFHWNDVPDTPPPGQMGDKDRIFPGDGILPLDQALRDLYFIGYQGPLSLELFRREHYRMDPLEVCRQGVEKMQANVARALG
jgi:2-keto-myo-inositol isomerase